MSESRLGAPQAIVTIEITDWLGDPHRPARLAIPVALDEDEVIPTFAHPLAGAFDGIVDQAVAGLDTSPVDDPAWLIGGVRYDYSEDANAPDLLPGETFFPGGVQEVNAMLRREGAKMDAELAEA
jgi:hypothetical protein